MNTKARFVVHKHSRENEVDHWDLMLEAGEVLQTFRMEIAPEQAATADQIKLTKIADHDKKFLEYEGPVNNGNGRAVIVEQGVYQVIEEKTENEIQKTQASAEKIGEGIFELAQTRPAHPTNIHFEGSLIEGEFEIARIRESEFIMKRKEAE